MPGDPLNTRSMNFLTSADAINGDALSASSLTNLAFLGLYMTAPTSFYIPNCFAISDSSLADVKVNDIGSFTYLGSNSVYYSNKAYPLPFKKRIKQRLLDFLPQIPLLPLFASFVSS